MSERLLHRLAWIVVILCAAPILAAGLAALTGDWQTWSDVLGPVLPRYAGATLALVVIVGVSTAVVGSITAWLVTVYRFPGVRLLEVALALPLAFPAYVLAYAYTHLLDHPGPVQTLLREVTGWGPRDYWFPEIRSLGGADTGPVAHPGLLARGAADGAARDCRGGASGGDGDHRGLRYGGLLQRADLRHRHLSGVVFHG